MSISSKRRPDRTSLTRPRRAFPSDSFPIVGIGASAGGLEAFSRLLARLPPNTGMAFIFVQHLTRDHASLLTELLSKTTPMTVTEARHGVLVKPDNVYVIPPNTGLVISQRTIHLHRRLPPPAVAWPIDDFFYTLARDVGAQAIGVILSGNASDGALGLKAIKEAGGITFVQTEASAKFSEMPHNAVAAGGADKILKPGQIARELNRIGRHTYVRRTPEKADEALSLPETDLPLIFELLQATTGIDYRHYRQTTLRRRIQRRMLLRKIDGLRDYLVRLRRDPEERAALSQDMLIHTTSFFRDPKTFQALEKIVYSRLMLRRSEGVPLRIWVPGCSTGQEVYSLAIALTEFQARHPRNFPIRIFASDIEEAAIQKARKGIYAPNEMSGLSSQRTQRFFTKVAGGYQIAKSIRELCVFARQDIVHDPPFSNISLISCRNVLIYLEPIWQKKVLAFFHFALEKDGFLLLGPSETPSPFFRSFSNANKEYRIYTKVPRVGGDYARWNYPRKAVPWHAGTAFSGIIPPPSRSAEDIERFLRSFNLAAANPPSGKEAKQIREKTLWQKQIVETLTHFQTTLEEQERTAEEIQSNNEQLQSTNEELETAKEELQSSNEELVTLSEELQTRNTELTQLYDDLNNLFSSVQIPLLMIGNDLGIRRVTATAKHFGISPEDVGKPISEFKNQLSMPDIDSILAKAKLALAPFEREIQDSQGDWYSLQIYPYRTAADEVEGAVISLLNIDARKRSETRMQELRDFALAIVDTVRAPLVVLKADLRVKIANRSFYEIFKLTSDGVVGRLFFELGSGQWNIPKLRSALQELLANKIPLTDFSLKHEFPGLGRCSLILNAGALNRPGVETEILLSIQDVTKSLKLQELLVRSGKMSAVGKLAAGIAHELNNPLAVILGFVQGEIRRARPHAQDLQEMLTSVERETLRCSRLVQDLLSFARPRGVGKTLENPGTILQNVFSLIATQAKMNKVKIIHQIDKRLPQISIDRDQFTQVIINLCTNAMDAMPRGGTLTVALSPHNGSIKLSVTDTGVGMTPEVRARIFDPFFTTKEVGKGTGLGLSLTYEIVKDHSGSIDVESEPGQGSTFSVILPLSREGVAEVPERFSKSF